MINLQKPDDQPDQQPEYTATAAPPSGGVPSAPWFDDVDHSVEPTSGVYFVRRAGVVIAMLGLIVVGAVGGRYFVQSESAPVAALAVPRQDANATPPPAPESVEDGDAPGPSGVAAPTLAEAARSAADSANADPDADPAYALPERASRLVPITPERLLDSGADTDTDSNTSAKTGEPYVMDVSDNWTAVALAVTIGGSPQAGSVLVDGGLGAIEAIAVDRAGASTTNLVVVPIIDGTLEAWSTAGGRVMIDLVGGFEQSGPTAAGRFVATTPIQVAGLVTKVDGRETTLSISDAVPDANAGAVLVAIGADVGADGGMVRFGPEAEQYEQALMWGPPADAETDTDTGEGAGGNVRGARQRRGLVLLQPNDDGSAYLRYDGGSELTAHVVGYFTGDEAAIADDGLYVPSGPRRLHDGTIGSGEPVVVGDLGPTTGTALVTVGSTSTGPGQLGTYLLPVQDGQTTLTTSTDLDAVVTLLGEFIVGGPQS